MHDRLITEAVRRPEPAVTDRTLAFWHGGAEGVLAIARCGDCGRFCHPPLPVCPSCHSRVLAPAPVSGRGVAHSWTISRYEWQPGLTPPYVIAEIELVEQAELRLTSGLVEVALDDVRIGMPVDVCFVRSGDAYIPLFRPVRP